MSTRAVRVLLVVAIIAVFVAILALGYDWSLS
jgi:nitrogen fixation-related uncharacterized protein